MPKQLDIGSSGFTRTRPGYEGFGVDIVDHSKEPNAGHIKRADLIVEPIPFATDEFDLVTAHDFLEHVPQVIYYTADVKQDIIGGNKYPLLARRQVMIELFNEVYRVLKDGGLFYSITPVYPDRSVFQDPTHLSVWTEESFNYFSGDYFGWHDHYGHTSRFEQVSKTINNETHHIEVTLRAIKNLPKDHPYKIKYDYNTKYDW